MEGENEKLPCLPAAELMWQPSIQLFIFSNCSNFTWWIFPWLVASLVAYAAVKNCPFAVSQSWNIGRFISGSNFKCSSSNFELHRDVQAFPSHYVTVLEFKFLFKVVLLVCSLKMMHWFCPFGLYDSPCSQVCSCVCTGTPSIPSCSAFFFLVKTCRSSLPCEIGPAP